MVTTATLDVTHPVDIEGVATEAKKAVETEETAKTDTASFPRLVQRNLPFSQSKNRLSVMHNKGYEIVPLLKYDWFHVFLRLPSKISLFMLLSVWTGTVLIFAGFYMAYDNINGQEVCRLGVTPEKTISFGAAFAFSVETCTTVGYGTNKRTNDASTSLSFFLMFCLFSVVACSHKVTFFRWQGYLRARTPSFNPAKDSNL